MYAARVSSHAEEGPLWLSKRPPRLLLRRRQPSGFTSLTATAGMQPLQWQTSQMLYDAYDAADEISMTVETWANMR